MTTTEQTLVPAPRGTATHLVPARSLRVNDQVLVSLATGRPQITMRKGGAHVIRLTDVRDTVSTSTRGDQPGVALYAGDHDLGVIALPKLVHLVSAVNQL